MLVCGLIIFYDGVKLAGCTNALGMSLVNLGEVVGSVTGNITRVVSSVVVKINSMVVDDNEKQL